MAIQAQEIEELIRAEFPKAQVTITDLAGDGNHYAAEVIDESFRGKIVRRYFFLPCLVLQNTVR